MDSFEKEHIRARQDRERAEAFGSALWLSTVGMWRLFKYVRRMWGRHQEQAAHEATPTHQSPYRRF